MSALILLLVLLTLPAAPWIALACLSPARALLAIALGVGALAASWIGLMLLAGGLEDSADDGGMRGLMVFAIIWVAESALYLASSLFAAGLAALRWRTRIRSPTGPTILL